MPSKGKKEVKKVVAKTQPQSGKVEKASSKKNQTKGPQKGVEKVAKIVGNKNTKPVTKSVPVKKGKKETKKESESKKKAEKKPSSSSEDESMEDSSRSGSSSSGSGSSSSGSGSSSSGSGSGSSSSSDEKMAVPTKEKKAEPKKKSAPATDDNSSGETKVEVGNLVFTITDENVHDFFKNCGTITNIEWIEAQGRFSGKGVLTFSTPAEAAKAVAKNGENLLSRPLRANLFGAKQATWQHDKSFQFGEPTNTIILKGLSYNASVEDINEAFASVASDFQTRIAPNGGIGFVECNDLETSKKVLEHAAKGLSIAGRVVAPDYAKPRGDAGARGGAGGAGAGGAGGNRSFASFSSPKPENGTTFFVGGLPFSVEESDVRNAFSGCNIANIRWVERDGVFKGVAFVEFADTKTADQAVNKAKNGINIGGRAARLDWAAPSSGGGGGGGGGGGRKRY